MRRLVLVLALAAAALVGGCLRVVQEPPLQVPPIPQLQFSLQNGNVCLSQEDADKLLKYIDKIKAFEAARTRVVE